MITVLCVAMCGGSMCMADALHFAHDHSDHMRSELPSVFVRVTAAVMKRHDQKHAEAKEFI